MQHDVFAHPLARARRIYPYIVVLQSDISNGNERLSAPLFAGEPPWQPDRGAPAILFEGRLYSLFLTQMSPVPSRVLRRPVGSIAAHRDDIVRALDWLFTGL